MMQLPGRMLHPRETKYPPYLRTPTFVLLPSYSVLQSDLDFWLPLRGPLQLLTFTLHMYGVRRLKTIVSDAVTRAGCR